MSSTHRAENSSKVSSWCSERMRLDVVKLGAARAARAIIGWGRAATRLARKKLEGPRTATRKREADIFALEKARKIKTRAGRSRRAGNWRRGGARQRWAGPGKSLVWQLNWVQSEPVCVGVDPGSHGYWHRTIFRLCEPRCSLSRLAVVFCLPAPPMRCDALGKSCCPLLWLGTALVWLVRRLD